MEVMGIYRHFSVLTKSVTKRRTQNTAQIKKKKHRSQVEANAVESTAVDRANNTENRMTGEQRVPRRVREMDGERLIKLAIRPACSNTSQRKALG